MHYVVSGQEASYCSIQTTVSKKRTYRHQLASTLDRLRNAGK